jgi:hypothetical protein
MSKSEDAQNERFDHFWTRIQSGEATLDDVLKETDTDQEALRSLLTVAAELRETLQPAEPDALFARNSEIRVLNQLRARHPDREMAHPVQLEKRGWFRRLAPALAGILLAAALTLGMVGVGRASAESLPGDLLYRVKLGIEQARLTLTFDEEKEAGLIRAYVDERLAEIEALVRLERTDELVTATEMYIQALDRLRLAGAEVEADESSTAMGAMQNIDHHIEVLQRVQAQVPSQAQAAIQRAIDRSIEHAQEKEERRQQKQDDKENKQDEKEQRHEEKNDEQEEAQDGDPNASRDQRTAEQIARQFGVTSEEVMAVFNGGCRADWKCVREFFREEHPGKGKSE